VSVNFLSPEWLERAQQTLTELAARDGTDGTSVSMCEAFNDAPAGSVGQNGDGRAAWHFRLDGTRCVAGGGEIDDADVKLVFDYDAVLPYARKVIDPATADTAEPLPIVSFEGDATKLPAFLLELHNRLATQTA
jgi:hypothetical protein